MTIIQKISYFLKKKYNYFTLLEAKSLKIQKFNPLILISFLLIFTALFFVTSNIINKKSANNFKNLEEISKTNEFSNFTSFLISKINSPYKEINYIVENNDNIEKILKKFKVIDNDIKNISKKLKQKKLTNIYSGKKLSLIIKNLDKETNTVVSLVYPINNTTSIEIRKNQENFDIKENILQLYKKKLSLKISLKIIYIILQ